MSQEPATLREAGEPNQDLELADFDVAIVGAGLAGGSLALRLARRGVRVVLLESHRFPRQKLCGEYLSPEGVELLENLGLGPALETLKGHTMRRLRLTTPRGSLLEATVAGPDGRHALGLSRALLDQLILDTAIGAGVELCCPARVSGPLIEEGRVVGVSARTDSGRVEFRAKAVVAANGRHSSLVKETGKVRIRSRGRPGHFGLKCHLAPDANGGEPPETVGLHLVRGGYVGTCQIQGGLNNLCGLLKESDLKQDRGDLMRLSDRVFAGNATLAKLWEARQEASPWKTVAAVHVQVSTPNVPGIFYVGDSQGTVDPLGGQGMTMALLGAELLEPYLLKALTPSLADTSLQPQYQRAWHHRFDQRIQLCRAFHQALVHPGVLDAVAPFKNTTARLMTKLYQLTRDHHNGPV